MKRLIFLSLAILATICSCGSKETVDDYDATINVSGNISNINLLADEGASYTLYFSCDHNWKVQNVSDDWLSFSEKSGDGGRSEHFTITAEENENTTTRKLTFDIVSGANSKTITVIQAVKALVLTEADIEDFDKYYKPAEFSSMDMLRSDSKWSWCRSKQSEHAIVFWDKKYGEYGLYGERMGQENTSPSTCKKSSMRVDIDDLLYKAELFYEMNVHTLKFVDIDAGDQCCLNKYKFEIYLIYQDEWLATGSGYDNKIGALWVNPSTCQPVGSTIAHEIGHSFQYMVYCDYLLRGGTDNSKGPGWRYGYESDGSGGNAFWEQSAQWQSYQNFDENNNYIPQAFVDYYASAYFSSTYMHVMHENPRYSNYFIHWWWVEAAGNDLSFIGKLWNEAVYPEDPCETYMRLMGMDVAAFNDDFWKYAAHMTTFDTEILREYGAAYVGKQCITDFSTVDGAYRVSTTHAPESCGYNSIKLNVPDAGETVTVNFQGLTSVDGYNCGSAAKAGWRYGFVAYMSDGTSQYSEIGNSATGSLSYTVPSGTSKLFLVVTGAPKEYERHPWGDESTSKDARWPYQFTLDGTDIYGNVTFDGTETPHNVSFTQSVTLSYDASGYTGTYVEIDAVALAKAFVLQPSDIFSKISSSSPSGGTIKYYGVNADGSYYKSGYTANTGFWYNNSGNVDTWSNGFLYSELDTSGMQFYVGQYPGKCKGSSTIIRQAFVYTKDGTDYTATFTFNVSVK